MPGESESWRWAIANILDESVVRSFEAPVNAINDALRFGSELAEHADLAPEEVRCLAYPPDGVKMVLSTEDRTLHLYFFGSGRAVYGQNRASTGERIGAGEFSLEETGHQERFQLFQWLAEG